MTHGQRASSDFYARRAQQEYGKITGKNPEEDARRLQNAQGFEAKAEKNKGGKAGGKNKNIEDSDKSLANIDKQMEGVARRLKSIESKMTAMNKPGGGA
jgi:excinuclease UvrABC helicase subunit UvrB